MWRLQNRQAAPSKREEERALMEQEEEPSFTDITLDVRH
jgi:twitching motility protein PilU